MTLTTTTIITIVIIIVIITIVIIVVVVSVPHCFFLSFIYLIAFSVTDIGYSNSASYNLMFYFWGSKFLIVS